MGTVCFRYIVCYLGNIALWRWITRMHIAAPNFSCSTTEAQGPVHEALNAVLYALIHSYIPCFSLSTNAAQSFVQQCCGLSDPTTVGCSFVHMLVRFCEVIA